MSVSIAPVNDAPAATADTATAGEGGSVSTLDDGAASLLDNDLDADMPDDSLTMVTTPVATPLVVGASGLERELRDQGLEVVTSGHAATRMHQEGIDGWTAAGAPDAVISGLDPNLTYLRLAAAADCIRAGARFIATNRDPVYPTERGLRPGAGTVAAALEATTGVTPLSIGKPSPHLLQLAAEAVGRDPHEAIMIGDGIGTDLAAARAVGARSILMLTGVTTRAEVEALPADDRRTAVAGDAEGLAAALEALAAATPTG